MSCYLRFAGIMLNVDKLIQKSNLEPDVKWYKGQPKYKSKPDGKLLENSGITIETSSADFDDLTKQIEDTISYLEKHQNSLKHINVFPGIEYAILDFGIKLRIDNENVVIQNDHFPNQLLFLAGTLGLSMQCSIYGDIFET